MKSLEPLKTTIASTPIQYKVLAAVATGAALCNFLFQSLNSSFEKFNQLESCTNIDELGAIHPDNRRFISLEPNHQLLVDSLTWIDDSTIQMKNNPSQFKGKPFKILILARLMSDTANELIENDSVANKQLSGSLTGKDLGNKIKFEVKILLEKINFPSRERNVFLSHSLDSVVNPDSFFSQAQSSSALSIGSVNILSERFQRNLNLHLIAAAKNLSDPSIPESIPEEQSSPSVTFKGSFFHEDR